MSLSVDRRYSQIGIDRIIRLEWLERAAYLVLAGNEASAVKETLQEEIQWAFRSKDTKVRGSIDKTLTILMRVWVHAPSGLGDFQREGLELLAVLPQENHIAVHWGMIMAVYPFWGAVAAHVGRLIGLQGLFTAGQVQRRVREQYGERETVSRRARYVLRSFVNWRVIEETSNRGIYAPGSALQITQLGLIAWLTEALLHANPNGSTAFKEIISSPSIFPFQLAHVSIEQIVGLSSRLDILRHSFNEDVVMLRR